jgi:hypothetical protein
MVPVVGFDHQEESNIRHLVKRFAEGDFHLSQLQRIEKAELPGYDGKVVPSLRQGCMETTMFLASYDRFTVAHELAHVSDIAVRRQDSLDNLSCSMPPHWHLAYKMSSEYYANRVASGFADGDDCFRAFRSDAAGLMDAAANKEWGSFLVYYALLLGILHGIGKPEIDPLAMLGVKTPLPARVMKGMTNFARHAVHFFEGYGDLADEAIAAA